MNSSITLREAKEKLTIDEQGAIPRIIWLLENPASPIALPGACNLPTHDYIHCVLGVGVSSPEEAIVLGFCFGTDIETRWYHIWIFKFFAMFIYPRKFRVSLADLVFFQKGFRTGRQSQRKNLHETDFREYLDFPLWRLRKELKIDLSELD